jgi:hypothetical protein
MSDASSHVLSDQDIEHFLEKGFVVVKGAISRETSAEWMDHCWTRLGIDPQDRSTWNIDRVHMGGTRHAPMKELAPQAYAAACQLLGGEDRIQGSVGWSDHFIVNLGERADQPWEPAGPSVPGWHKDGDFFRHYLDSPEQGLLTIVLWTDVVHQGGPTYLATDSVGVIARWLEPRREGVLPGGFGFMDRIAECREFAEATGSTGDVYLIHPYALHAVSQNVLRVPRVITNPPIHLKEPMNFNRDNPADFSPVERAVLKGLGVERLDYQIAGQRERIVPEREKMQAKMMEEERLRLAQASQASQ